MQTNKQGHLKDDLNRAIKLIDVKQMSDGEKCSFFDVTNNHDIYVPN